jgi:hypothetical protein
MGKTYKSGLAVDCEILCMRTGDRVSIHCHHCDLMVVKGNMKDICNSKVTTKIGFSNVSFYSSLLLTIK